jgi:hypothetical protein
MPLTEKEKQAIGTIGISPLVDMFLKSCIEHPGDCEHCGDRLEVVGWSKHHQSFLIRCSCCA